MKIYTRTGDEGTTSLFSKERVSKNNPIIDAIGSVDEGNSALGLALSLLPIEQRFNETRAQLEMIQHGLFDVGAALAKSRSSHEIQKLEKNQFDQESIELLEKWIDVMDTQLPALKNFILPGGHPCGAALHVTRSTIRRAERLVTPLYMQGDVTQAVLVYLNRLSDYLFMVSRYVNHVLQVPEIKWEAHKVLHHAK